MNPEEEILKKMDEVIDSGLYKPEWDSLMENKAPGWFFREKLGIFIHWGLYSIPAYSNEWYSRNMYRKGTEAFEHHRKTYGSKRLWIQRFYPPVYGEKL